MKMSSLKVGVDVPWVTSWTGEPPLGMSIGPGRVGYRVPGVPDRTV